MFPASRTATPEDKLLTPINGSADGLVEPAASSDTRTLTSGRNGAMVLALDEQRHPDPLPNMRELALHRRASNMHMLPIRVAGIVVEIFGQGASR